MYLKFNIQKPLLGLFFSFWLISLSFSCQSAGNKSTSETVVEEQEVETVKSVMEDIDTATFKSKIGSENHVLLDVRTAEEVAQGSIEGAEVIDFYGDDFRQKIEALDKDKTYLVYCRSGGRSGKTCKMMQEIGFTNLYNLEGGYSNWPYKE
jgi:rhodanese-related sulfurtransferase